MKINLEKLQTGFLLLATVGLSFDNLRLGLSGITLSPEISGTPFLWEVALLGVFVTAVVRLSVGTNRRPNRYAQLGLLVSLAVFLPFLFNVLLFSSDIANLLVGNGQLRVILYQWGLFVILLLNPLQSKHVVFVVYAIIFSAVANSIYSILAVAGVFTPEHWSAQRSFGVIRASGFFEMPSRLGVLITLAVGLVLGLRISPFLKVLMISGMLYALLLSDSRTGMVGVFVVICIYLLRKLSMSPPVRLLLLFFLGGLVVTGVIAGFDDIKQIDSGRIAAYSDAVHVWTDHILGISLGEWSRYSQFPPPHNSVLFYFVYGGLISGVSVLTLIIWLLKRSILVNEDQLGSRADIFYPSLVGFIAASLFEQVVLHANNAIFFLILLAAYIVAYKSGSRTPQVESPGLRVMSSA